jgi:hypothetical protein
MVKQVGKGLLEQMERESWVKEEGLTLGSQLVWVEHGRVSQGTQQVLGQHILEMR